VALTRARVRVRVAGMAAVGSAMVVVAALHGSASALPADPAPLPATIASTTTALSDASRQAERAAEAYNLATGRLAAADQAAVTARRVAAVAAADYQRERSAMTDLVRVRYEGDSFGTAGALLDSTDARGLINRMGTLDVVSSRFGATIAAVGRAKIAADVSRTQAVARQRDAQVGFAKAQGALADAEAKKRRFQAILASLSATQLAQYNSGTIPPTVARGIIAAGARTLSAKQKTIVDYAQAQVGKPYVFAAAGPDAYDCSGLVKAAFALLGFDLTHYAPTQYSASGDHPSATQLQPGDLVFLYPDIGHVEIYVGGGLAVSAADEELGIRYVNVFADMGSWYGATRLL
jgi:cell wall-associated NlpC family hydrolase